MNPNSSKVCLMAAILVVSLILFISPTIAAESSGNDTFSISGSVHNDVNGNGIYDSGDRGIPDVYILLKDSNNVTRVDTDTDINGIFSIRGIKEGDYYLERVVEKGWKQVNPNSSTAYNIKLNRESVKNYSDIDFLDRRIPIEKGGTDFIALVKADIKGATSYLWPGVVWFSVFVFMCLLVLFTLIKLHSAIGKKKVDTNESDCSCNYLLLFVLIGTAFLGWTFYIYGKPFYIIPLIGIACLAIPLILSISADYNIGSKLDNGEIRKAIVISLTVVYIIFLAISFEKSIDDTEMNIQSYDANFTMKIDKEINKEMEKKQTTSQTMNLRGKINSNIEDFATPERLTADFSSNKTEVILISKENNSDNAGRNVPLPSSSANASSQQMIPEEVMATFTKNFLYVYILIILFYFGSRFVDEYRTSSTLEKYLSKGNQEKLDIDGITAARFALGDIGAREYKETIDALGYRADKTIEVSKYALSVAISDVEKKYEAWKEADAHEKETIEKFKVMQAGIGNHTVTASDLENARTQKEDAANQLKNAKADFETAIANVDKIKKELMDAENKMSG